MNSSLENLDPKQITPPAAVVSPDAAEASSSERKQSGKPASTSVLRYILLPFYPLSWLLKLVFGRRRRDADIEKTLQHLSKEEVNVHVRKKRRTASWRRLARDIMLYSAVVELVILGITLSMLRAADRPLQENLRLAIPALLFPLLSSALYSLCSRVHAYRDSWDSRVLVKLAEQRKAHLEELKDLTNYYKTHELVQRYEASIADMTESPNAGSQQVGAKGPSPPDHPFPLDPHQPGLRRRVNAIQTPALPGLPASLPESTLPGGRPGTHAGTLQLSGLPQEAGGAAASAATPRGLIAWPQPHGRSAPGVGATTRREAQGAADAGPQQRLGPPAEASGGGGSRSSRSSSSNSSREGRALQGEGSGLAGRPHRSSGDAASGGFGAGGRRLVGRAADEGWIARLAAMLVGEDPTQCFALICRSCHAHNGLARREDFPYITYVCPWCNAVNESQAARDSREEGVAGTGEEQGGGGQGARALGGEGWEEAQGTSSLPARESSGSVSADAGAADRGTELEKDEK